MKSKTRRIVIVIVFVVVAVAAVFGFSALANNGNSEPEPTPSSTKTAVSLDERRQAIAENSAQLFMTIVMEDAQKQAETPETFADVIITPSTASEDADGKDAYVATVVLSGFPYPINVEQNIAYFDEVFAAVEQQEGLVWTYVAADPSEFEGDNILGVVKAYEDSDNPTNPAIVEVVYLTNPETGGFEIQISATVY